MSLNTVSKAYAGVSAVETMSLDVEEGELLCLLGPSGCGKTTTLRMLAGFIDPTSGTITIDGVDVTSQPPYKRDIGMVFQNYALFPHLTVAGNVEYGLINIGMPRQKRRERVSEMLTRVELNDLAGRYPKALSGGQQQRVALARALALRPKVLLLDEPFSNLDAQLRVRLREDLHSLIRGLNMTTLFVTHDQDEALMLADRIVVMNKGKVEQIGSPEEIYDAPASRFVAEFIGWCSVLDGRFDGTGFLTSGGMHLPVEGAPGLGTVIIRPEYVHLDVQRPGMAKFSGVVESSSYYGAVSRLKVKIGADVLLMDGHFPPGTRPQPGDPLEVAVDPSGIRHIRS
ncbi:ABC transporter ATP-binding protein [Bradyrhizobium sp. CCBAU 53380]|uniref:ABC transporter ATP-binding protein n=1 Tax=Bradyrhizobium sp. CCBAU 53380 TaxID=1325117 RepID=UPI0023027E73|nr:ABC transporter ATP-binding protein [Bradyrhizobium sp. CCBAU 53380]